MNNTFSVDKIAKSGDLNADWIMRQNKLVRMAKFMEIKSMNPNLERPEIAGELKVSSSTLQRYKRKRNMFPPERIPQSLNTQTRKQKTEHESKVTSIDLKVTSNGPVKNKKNK